MTVRDYRLISADGHLMDPPDLWTSNAPAKYRDRVPRMERFEQGDAWVFPDRDTPSPFNWGACAGRAPDEQGLWCRLEDINPGCYDAKARVEALDLDGVDAELLFPNGLDWVVDSSDREFHLTMTRIYNDHLATFCAYAPDRFGGAALVPAIGADDAIAEVQRLADAPGIAAYLLKRYPHGDSTLRGDEDDAVWAAIVETGKPVAIHVSLRSAASFNMAASALPGTVHFYDAPSRMLDLIPWIDDENANPVAHDGVVCALDDPLQREVVLTFAVRIVVDEHETILDEGVSIAIGPSAASFQNFAQLVAHMRHGRHFRGEDRSAPAVHLREIDQHIHDPCGLAVARDSGDDHELAGKYFHPALGVAYLSIEMLPAERYRAQRLDLRIFAQPVQAAHRILLGIAQYRMHHGRVVFASSLVEVLASERIGHERALHGTDASHEFGRQPLTWAVVINSDDEALDAFEAIAVIPHELELAGLILLRVERLQSTVTRHWRRAIGDRDGERPTGLDRDHGILDAFGDDERLRASSKRGIVERIGIPERPFAVFAMPEHFLAVALAAIFFVYDISVLEEWIGDHAAPRVRDHAPIRLLTDDRTCIDFEPRSQLWRNPPCLEKLCVMFRQFVRHSGSSRENHRSGNSGRKIRPPRSGWT